MLKTNLEYFFTTTEHGNMNTNPSFYEGMTEDEIKKDFTERRIKLGQELGINGLKILTQVQKTRPTTNGKTKEEIKVMKDTS